MVWLFWLLGLRVGMDGFSVVIPLYNKREFIRRTMMSVVAQHSEGIEVILIDDGSTDDGLSLAVTVLKKYKINYHYLIQQNQGVSVARNKGIAKAKYKYICLLDADDVWEEGYLDVMAGLINKYPNKALYSCDHEVFDAEVGRSRYQHPFLKSGYFEVEDYFSISSNYPLVNSSKVILNREVVGELKFPEGITLGEDLFFWIECYLRGGLAFTTFLGVRINQYEDKSRVARLGKVPYPILYYNNWVRRGVATRGLKNYIFKIHVNHILKSIADIRRSEAVLRIKAGRKIFPIYTIFFYIILLVPSKVLCYGRNFRRVCRRWFTKTII